MYIYSWNKIDKILTHFGDALCKNFIACGVQLDHSVSPWALHLQWMSLNWHHEALAYVHAKYPMQDGCKKQTINKEQEARW